MLSMIQSIIQNGRGLLNIGAMEVNLEVVQEIQECHSILHGWDIAVFNCDICYIMPYCLEAH
jgi:hypothetical protein